MTPEERKSFRLAIVDTEFSDLDLSLCELLEVAILIVDLDLNEHARKSWIADNSILKSAKARMSPEVLEMHTKSGLLAEIEKHVWAPPSKVLDVHTDREVLRNQASEVKWDDFFHYRLCNVSTPREMARWWSPSAALAEVDKKENLPHRAMIDCERVVFELKHYKEKIFDAVTLADEHHRNFPKVSR
jgi:oligoribonuclease (3'-5' exoribonuclease)